MNMRLARKSSASMVMSASRNSCFIASIISEFEMMCNTGAKSRIRLEKSVHALAVADPNLDPILARFSISWGAISMSLASDPSSHRL